MILYSIVPIDVIFGHDYDKSEYSFIEIEYEGEKVEVTPLSSSTYKINRIISTSPKAYLNPKLMPGNIVESTIL
jgi:hypothetical protein